VLHGVEFAPRRGAIIEHRTEQPLRRSLVSSFIVQPLHEAGGKSPTGALAADHDTPGVDA
jgi:hypothetical protein